MNVIVLPNLQNRSSGVANWFNGTPAGGLSPYDDDLAALGSGGFSAFGIYNLAPHAFSFSFNSWGWPLMTFCDVAATTHLPRRGLGLWVTGSYQGPALRYFNGYDGATASTYREVGYRGVTPASGNLGLRQGLWEIFGFSKASGSSAVTGSIRGATPTLFIANGTATTVGTPSKTDLAAGGSFSYPAKVRWFHSAESFSSVGWDINAAFPGAGAVWILDRTFDQNALNAITANVAALAEAMNDTYIGNLICRSWSGARDWRSVAENGVGVRPTNRGEQ